MSVASTHRPAGPLFPGAGGWITAVILTMPIRQLSLLTLGGANLRVGDIVLGAAVALWLGTLFLNPHVTRRRTGLDWAITLFVVACALSLIWSQQSSHGWLRVSKLGRNLALYGMLVAYLRHDFETGFRRLALALVAAGLLQSLAFLYSIGQYGGAEALSVLVNADSLLSNDSRLAVVKTENGAGLFLRGAASWLGLCLFFGVGVAHRVKTRFGARVIWASVISMILLTILTMSRSAWIALVTGGIANLAGLRPRNVLKFGGIALLVFLALWQSSMIQMVSNVFTSRLSGYALSNDPSLDDRWEYINLALGSFERSPWIGGGAAGIDPNEFITVHNVYLQVLGELGILGIATFGAVLLCWMWLLFGAWQRSRAGRDESMRRTTAAMAGITIFFFTYFFAGHDLESSEPWIVMAASSAIFAVMRWPAGTRRARGRRPSAMVARPIVGGR